MSDLTKWPRLLVSGERVTPEQANEILIRTCQPAYLGGNDKQWDETVARIMKFRDDENWHLIPELREDNQKKMAWLKERWAAQDARADELGIVSMEYLYTSRITSANIFGPHGWCDWNGNIFTDSYNIGKWPSALEITDEWQQIADAFPYLDLTAQLITDEGAGELAGEWQVKDGTVVYDPEPAVRLEKPSAQAEEDRMKWAVAAIATGWAGRERGVTPERLTEAVMQVDAAMAAKRAQAAS